ncbi:MAG: hypothetical protein EPO32_04765 [Anaerolineae bacterium]|nr:MAG: hypothetical protein EPO32_04765 [Anaerolineae bacterium]
MAAKRRLRWAALAWGALFLFWLPLEDVTPNAALGLAGGLCVWGAVGWTARRDVPPARWPWLGLVAGLALAPLAAGLLVFKSGLHSHGFPDFGPRQLLDLLAGMPAWGLGGALAGAGAWGIANRIKR